MQTHRRGFTLIEILIVLAIISILMALLFPAFKRAEEGGRQANCASNLAQIGIAIQLYKQDERRYPASLLFLMPPDTEVFDTRATATPGMTATPTGTPSNTYGTGYLKTPERMLVCPDDDTQSSTARSSYGDISTLLTYPASPYDTDTPRYLWNYWGYNDEGKAYKTYADMAAAYASNSTYLVSTGAAVSPSNVVKNSLANRYAPANTVVTHCIYHRLPTSNLSKPDDIYTDAANATGAKDIVLRVDGSAKTVDAASMKSALTWLKQQW